MHDPAAAGCRRSCLCPRTTARSPRLCHCLSTNVQSPRHQVSRSHLAEVVQIRRNGPMRSPRMARQSRARPETVWRASEPRESGTGCIWDQACEAASCEDVRIRIKLAADADSGRRRIQAEPSELEAEAQSQNQPPECFRKPRLVLRLVALHVNACNYDVCASGS